MQVWTTHDGRAGQEIYPHLVQTLARTDWEPRALAHAARVDRWIQPHLQRRRRGERHPVHDFMFCYYSHSPAALRRWHPGWGAALEDAPEYAGLKGYGVEEGRASVSAAHLDDHLPVIEAIHRLLASTSGRVANFSCFGLHEWAMVYRAEETRHPVPLRLGARGTDEVVEGHRIGCSHFDAFRFFTDAARPLNVLTPGRHDRPEFEQPGCLHATMDLYKHAFRLGPLVPGELVADCFEMAWDVREWDMRASPYDLSDLGLEPVRVETPQGKQAYVAAQRTFAERAAPLRGRLIDRCAELLSAAEPGPPSRPLR